MIKPADLVWRDGQPYSPAFDDIYHDRDGSVEVEQVYLAPVDFDALLAVGRPLVVGELGFGTGLNFAVTARRCLAAGVRMHFISFEVAPVAPDDFQRISRDRSADEPFYGELSKAYPPLLPGWHKRSFAAGRIQLSLFWGAAEEGLTSLLQDVGPNHNQGQREPVDLWLLDGFAPDRNPDMWAEELLQNIGRTARHGTRVSTFTSAGRVRRGLIAAGFETHRVNQRPRKWESLAGTFTGTGRPRIHKPDQVTIVGAGIAGAAAARTLAESGLTVTVVEESELPATGASSIPATVMHPRLHHDGSDLSNLKARAYAHALAATRTFADAEGTGVRRTGTLQIPSPSFPLDRLEAVAECYLGSGLDVRLIGAAEARELAGDDAFKLDTPVLWFPGACLVDTPRFTRTLLDHPGINVRTRCVVTDWPEGPVVLACGINSRSFTGAEYLELGTVHGQLDLVIGRQGPLRRLRLPVTGNGYVAPVDAERSLFGVGATYEYEPWPEDRASTANQVHVERLAGRGFEPYGSQKAERCVSSDRNPVIGRLYPLEEESTTMHPGEPSANSVDRLVTVGHGSMGTVSSHLAATLIEASLTGQFEPLAENELALVSARRFRTRQARRGYRFGAEP